MAIKKIKSNKKEGCGKASILDRIIERFPGYAATLRDERSIIESFNGFPAKKEDMMKLVHLVECLLSSYERNYKSFVAYSAAEDFLDHIWMKQDSFVQGHPFLPWLVACVANYGRNCIRDIYDIVGFDSSDISEDGGSVRIGYHGERNGITEKAQYNMRICQMDPISEEIARDDEKEYSCRRMAHIRQLRAEKAAFDSALDKALSELRPQSRLLYDLYNQEVPFNEIFRRINASTPGAARGRRDELVKTLERKMINYWVAPKGYHYDDPLEPMRKLLMEITFFKGWSKNVTKQLRVK